MRFMNAIPEDKDEILALYHSLVGTEGCAWTMNYPGIQEIEYDLSRESLFCIKNDNEIIGVISIDCDEEVEQLSCWSQNLKPAAELSRVGVRTDYQNRGIARELLQYGMLELKKQGKKSVHFLVCKTNEKAIHSYKAFNFNVVGECELFEEQWLCYEKEL